jgi:putative acyl-CoA dehydrogenase
VSSTHEVVNQAPPREGLNEYLSNPALAEAASRFGAGWAAGPLAEAGALVGRPDFIRDAELASTHPPVLASHDRWGRRIDAVEYHPAYHRIIAAAIAHGAHTSCWADPRPGAHVARAAMFMLFAQVEPGHACPVSMTHAVVPSLRLAPALAAHWLPRVCSRGYDPVPRAPENKDSALFGMAMTEKQGGSDVRANTTRAAAAGDGSYRLTGHKWFCSAPQSDAFLVLAQAAGGLSCFLVPRVLPGGQANVFRIQRLKDKLGNRSNASAEIELEQTAGWLVGEEGRGVAAIIEMVAQTRLDCVLGSTAGMRQAVAEAAWHARHRRAFGALLAGQPAMTAVLADLQLEAEAATWMAMRLAAAYDADDAESAAFRRLATAVAKYWVCKRGPQHAYEALECLGGNGYTEAFPLARRYREQPVMAIWEGSGNVIALDVLRAIRREPESAEAVDRELASARGVHPAYDAHVAATRSLLAQIQADPERAQARARRLVEDLALALQAAVLIREAPAAVGDAFVAARLGPGRSLEYGALDPGLDLAALVARA